MRGLDVRRRNNVLALLHLGLEDLAVVFHAHDVGLVGLGGRSGAVHRGVDVTGGEDVGGHGVWWCDCVGLPEEVDEGEVVGWRMLQVQGCGCDGSAVKF